MVCLARLKKLIWVIFCKSDPYYDGHVQLDCMTNEKYLVSYQLDEQKNMILVIQKNSNQELINTLRSCYSNFSFLFEFGNQCSRFKGNGVAKRLGTPRPLGSNAPYFSS
jgi:hypothetical protein